MITGNEFIYPSYDKEGVRHQGLTLRQYYAGLAMQGILASGRNDMTNTDSIAEYSVKHADAIIKALNQPTH